MRQKIILVILLSLSSVSSKTQERKLTKKQVVEDLEFARKTLNDKSSYAYLNGYDFNKDFDTYQRQLKETTSLESLGLFLTKTIGKIGDRHASVREFKLKDSIFLPFMFAPQNGQVAVLHRNDKKELALMNSNFPYLKKIDGFAVKNFLQKILPDAVNAPKEAHFTNAVRALRDIQKNYVILNKDLPKEITLTLSDSSFKKDTTFSVPLVDRTKRPTYWDEQFERQYALIKDEDYNKTAVIDKLFEVKDEIAYIKIPAMVSKADAPLLFEKLNAFMQSATKNSKALIIDVRSNGGGTRDLTYELAKYFVHPDSIYVVNATKQRGPNRLNKEDIESLHDRNLYAFAELDNEEKKHVTQFSKAFKPMYDLNKEKYSEYYFGLFNGKKIAEKSAYYNKPIYILANEKSFSAASVFVAIFKGLPNIKIVGVTTDGSSGNSERFELPNSKLRIKISTMVSFQKDGKILDGFGTEPDLKIERDIDQIIWKKDSQLEKLRTLILKN
ncbi:MAG: peptidase S41 [Flavobacterium sp.]|nr:MAG: peptidase S41 [Flavobacterium sp.]